MPSNGRQQKMRLAQQLRHKILGLYIALHEMTSHWDHEAEGRQERIAMGDGELPRDTEVGLDRGVVCYLATARCPLDQVLIDVRFHSPDQCSLACHVSHVGGAERLTATC